MIENKTILVLAPHTDDGELGCGATISKWLAQGNEVFYIAFSTAEESVPEGWPKDQLAKEVKKATLKLGIPADHLIIYNYAVRKLNYVRQEILESLIKLRPEINPDVVLLPCSQDVHQDHRCIHQEGIRAFKQCTILGYELIWNNLSFSTDLFVVLEEQHIQNKIDALNEYETQRFRTYMKPEFIRSLAVVRGVQVQEQYAESFEVIRWIIK